MCIPDLCIYVILQHRISSPGKLEEWTTFEVIKMMMLIFWIFRLFLGLLHFFKDKHT